jgi:hypothetical protein
MMLLLQQQVEQRQQDLNLYCMSKTAKKGLGQQKPRDDGVAVVQTQAVVA